MFQGCEGRDNKALMAVQGRSVYLSRCKEGIRTGTALIHGKRLLLKECREKEKPFRLRSPGEGEVGGKVRKCRPVTDWNKIRSFPSHGDHLGAKQKSEAMARGWGGIRRRRSVRKN